MGSGEKKPKKPRAYSRPKTTKERPSVLTVSDRSKLEFKKKVREGKTLENYKNAMVDYINRQDSYEALVTLMDMYSNNVQPDVEIFSILIFGHFKIKLPHKAIDIFLDLAPAEMKMDSGVFDRLVSELVKAKQYSLLGRLKFLVGPFEKEGNRKQVANVNVSELAVKWARHWFPEMGELEINRIFGNFREFTRSSNSEPKFFVPDLSDQAAKIFEQIKPRQAGEKIIDDTELIGEELRAAKENEEATTDKETKEKEKDKEETETAPEEKKPLTKAELRNIEMKEKMAKLRAAKKAKEEAQKAQESGLEEPKAEEETKTGTETKKLRPKRRL